MEASQNSSMPKVTPKQLTNSKYRPDIEQDEDSEDLQKDEKTLEDEQIIDDETWNNKGAAEEGTEDSGASPNKKYIEDFYDNESDQNKDKQDEEADDQLDMDYSQTQLDDFLKSHSNRGLSSHQLLQSFVSTYNKTKNMSARAMISSVHGGSAQALLDGSHHKVQSISSAAKMKSGDKNHSI